MGIGLSTYPDSVRFLYALGNESRTLKLGLERISTLLESLGSPHRDVRFVHVAGTNGKGSVCAMIESALRAAGRRTGLYVSPHLVEPTERISVAGEPVSPAAFAGAFDAVHRKAEALLASGAIDSHPTYFETITAMAFLLYRELAAETVVLEVGMGGRLDATNVVLPLLSVITPVDYDHEGHLGVGLESIGREKAGIVKPGVPVVTGPQHPEVQALLEARARALGAQVTRWSQWSAEGLELGPHGSRFSVPGSPPLSIECPLAGEHQVSNALTAIAALRVLETPPEAIEEGLRRVRWPGRLERVTRRPEIVLDGAHNPSGARVLAGHIRRFYAGRRVRLVFGAMRDKALDEVAGILFPLAEEVVLTTVGHPRAVHPETILRLVDHPRLRVAPSLGEALGLARGSAPDDAWFITGSLYLVGAARALLVQ